MTYQEAARSAIQVQDACNLSGVVHSFSEAMSALWEEADRAGKGTVWVNRHPVARLFAEQVAYLCSGGAIGDEDYPYADAHRECEAIAREGEEDDGGL